MTVTLVHPIREASAMGAEHGKGAASWAFDGNTADHIYRAFLVGYDEGDPQIMDYYNPGSPLSGEWADGMDSADLLTRVGIGTDDAPWEANGTDALISAVLDAYESAFDGAYWAELQRVAHLHTDDTAD